MNYQQRFTLIVLALTFIAQICLIYKVVSLWTAFHVVTT